MGDANTLWVACCKGCSWAWPAALQVGLGAGARMDDVDLL